MPRQLRQTLNDRTGTETYFQHALVRSDFRKLGYPGAARCICSRHDNAADPPERTLRAVKHAHQNVRMMLIDGDRSSIRSRTGQRFAGAIVQVAKTA